MTVDRRYAFAENLPVAPVDPGTTLLVAGPALSAAEDVALSMVADHADAADGMLFISTNRSSEKLLDACDQTCESFDGSLAGVVDCTGQDPSPSRYDSHVKFISTQSDLTGIGMKFSALYENLYAAADTNRVRTGLVSLSSLSMYVDLRALFRFTQTLSGRIDSAGGIGAFTIDPTTHDTATVNTLSQTADGRVEVRETDEPDADGELRVRGLSDQPDGWQSFSLS